MRRFFGIRWLTIGLIMLGALVNFLSRQTLSVAAPTVIASLHITTQQYGWITSALPGRHHAATRWWAMSSTYWA